jgi:hypothetical protein
VYRTVRLSMRKDLGTFNIFMSFTYFRIKALVASFQSYIATIWESIELWIEQKYQVFYSAIEACVITRQY